MGKRLSIAHSLMELWHQALPQPPDDAQISNLQSYEPRVSTRGYENREFNHFLTGDPSICPSLSNLEKVKHRQRPFTLKITHHFHRQPTQ